MASQSCHLQVPPHKARLRVCLIPPQHSAAPSMGPSRPHEVAVAPRAMFPDSDPKSASLAAFHPILTSGVRVNALVPSDTCAALQRVEDQGPSSSVFF